MKRLIFLVILMSTVLMTNSCGIFKTIAFDGTTKGERYILTTDKKLFGNYDAALGCKIAGRDTVLAIMITSCEESNHGVFEKGSLLQIRTTDGTVFALKNVYDKEYEKSVETGVTQTPRTDVGYAYCYSPFADDVFLTSYTINRMVSRPYSYTSTLSYALYLISKPQLTKIIKDGVIKLRIETDSDQHDSPNPEMFSGMMKRCLHDLRVEAKNPNKSKGEF